MARSSCPAMCSSFILEEVVSLVFHVHNGGLRGSCAVSRVCPPSSARHPSQTHLHAHCIVDSTRRSLQGRDVGRPRNAGCISLLVFLFLVKFFFCRVGSGVHTERRRPRQTRPLLGGHSHAAHAPPPARHLRSCPACPASRQQHLCRLSQGRGLWPLGWRSGAHAASAWRTSLTV